ncbi:hypothetical protein A9Q99_06000 [Gammaproteobacteria bacterium 45_16_T64]|nr:hypothetical protein A9Q99_06000 [Gammaproteobacteria bacterium 45_16_T64]
MQTHKIAKYISVTLLSILACVSCATTSSSNKGLSKLERVNNSYIEEILRKVRFMSDCEENRIKFECISEPGRYCREFGVSACGAKSIYTSIGGNWIKTDSRLSVNSNLQALGATSSSSQAAVNSINGMSAANASMAASNAAASAAAAGAAASAAAASAAASAAAATPPPM